MSPLPSSDVRIVSGLPVDTSKPSATAQQVVWEAQGARKTRKVSLAASSDRPWWGDDRGEASPKGGGREGWARRCVWGGAERMVGGNGAWQECMSC